MFNKQIKAYFLLVEIGACSAAIHVLANDWQPHAIEWCNQLDYLLGSHGQAVTRGIRLAIRIARDEQRTYHRGEPNPYTRAAIEDALFEVIEGEFYQNAEATQLHKYAQLDRSLGRDEELIEATYFWQEQIPF